MSDIETLEREGLVSKRELQRIKERAKHKGASLKRQRRRIDAQARIAFKAYIENGRTWKGKKPELNRFRTLMDKRHKIHERLNRIVGEPVEPEWDSES